VDSVGDDEMTQAVIESNFDSEKSLDRLLKKSSAPNTAYDGYYDDYRVKPSESNWTIGIN